jgi:hypothetical protein
VYAVKTAQQKSLLSPSELVSVTERLRATNTQEPEKECSVRSGQAPRVWRVSDRLSEADLCNLVSITAQGRPSASLLNSSTSARAALSGSYVSGAYGGQLPPRNALHCAHAGG